MQTRAKSPLGQSDRAYYLSYFINNSSYFITEYLIMLNHCDYCTFIYVQIAVRGDGNVPSAFTGLTIKVFVIRTCQAQVTKDPLFSGTRGEVL